MSERVELDLLRRYQRDLQEGSAGREALKNLGIADPAVNDHFGLGYCCGEAIKSASEEQLKNLTRLRLVHNQKERLYRSVVIPVYSLTGDLVDLIGLRRYNGTLRVVSWQKPSTGLIGIEAAQVYSELILVDNPFHALHARQHGFQNVISLFKSKTDQTGSLERQLKEQLETLKELGVSRIHLVSRQNKSGLSSILEDAGFSVSPIHFPNEAIELPKESLEGVVLQSKKGGGKTGEIVETPEALELVNRTDHRLTFRARDAAYHVEAIASMGLKAVVRCASGGRNYVDRLDLASSSARRKFARMCADAIGLVPRKIESHLSAVAAKLDELDVETAGEEAKGAVNLPESEYSIATDRLKNEDVLGEICGCIANVLGFVGDEQNVRLAALIAASRLLPQPLGAILRGPAGSGKTELLRCATQALPSNQVLNFSRLTSQALYFMPKESLQHRVLMVDEYTGLENSEYSLRTMMSNQSLSLAITTREGGKVPVTQTVEIPATLAVMVSTTQAVGIENLSRFVELRLDDSAEQTQRVMAAMASGRKTAGMSGQGRRKLQGIRNMSSLLQPVAVAIPFAEKPLYGSTNVLARRQFAQVVGLIGAHAALFQFQRERDDSGEMPVVTATKADYEAVHPLLGSIVETFGEEISPAALQLVDKLEDSERRYFTRQDMMQRCGWSYSKVHRTLKELEQLNLVVPDKSANGTARNYELAPFHRDRSKVSQIVPPGEL